MKLETSKLRIAILTFIIAGLAASTSYSQFSQETFQKHYQMSTNTIPWPHRFESKEVSGSDILTAYGAGVFLYITRTNCCGEIIWAKKYESSFSYPLSSYPLVIHEVEGPAYVIGGSFGDCGDLFMIKIDANTGNVLWSQGYGGAG